MSAWQNLANAGGIVGAAVRFACVEMRQSFKIMCTEGPVTQAISMTRSLTLAKPSGNETTIDI
jgi:hypothetical protein